MTNSCHDVDQTNRDLIL